MRKIICLLCFILLISILSACADSMANTNNFLKNLINIFRETETNYVADTILIDLSNEFELPEPLPPTIDENEILETVEIIYISTVEYAHEIISVHYPNAVAINYFADDIISYTNPPAPVEVYIFEVYTDNDKIICAVSKERGIPFFYRDELWWAFGGAKEKIK